MEDWVEEGRAAGEKLDDRDDVTELWEWAGMAANEEARKHDWDRAEFTLEEMEMGVENVVTGLRKGLDEESDSDEEEEGSEEKMGDREMESRPMAMDDVLRFMVKGEQIVREGG